MKGAFEATLVLFFGMLFVLMGMDYVEVQLINTQARSMAENALSIIEHQNRYDTNVQALIDQSNLGCEGCSLHLSPHTLYPSRYWVVVEYPVHLAHINLQMNSEIRLLSRPLG